MGSMEPETLSRLFRDHAAALALYARQWTGSPEDVVQEAFLALAKQRRLPESIVAWLYRSVRNAAIDASRSAGRRQRREALVSPEEAWFQTADEGFDARVAAEALARIDPDLREVIVARVWGGLTFEEIAQVVAVPLSTVYRRYRAGLEELRKRLEGRWTHDHTTSPTI